MGHPGRKVQKRYAKKFTRDQVRKMVADLSPLSHALTEVISEVDELRQEFKTLQIENVALQEKLSKLAPDKLIEQILFDTTERTVAAVREALKNVTNELKVA